jgi:hypothetical protein
MRLAEEKLKESDEKNASGATLSSSATDPVKPAENGLKKSDGAENASGAKSSTSVTDARKERVVKYWKEKPVLMRDLIGNLDPAGGRVYLGPHRSETRRLATIVLGQCGQRNFERLSAHGIGDWYEVRAALNTGDIELAFLVGTLGHDVVNGIADDGNCRLVDLSEIAEALEKENREFRAAQIPSNAYAAAAYRRFHHEFCPQKITTLTSRDVIICSRNMTRFDAFQVAAAADEALRDDFPNGLWKQTEDSGMTLTTERHPGSELHKPGGIVPTFWSISNWPTWLLTIISTMGLLMLTGFLKRATAKIPESASGLEPTAANADGQIPARPGAPNLPLDLVQCIERWEDESLALIARIDAAAASVNPGDADAVEVMRHAITRVLGEAPRRHGPRARRNGSHPKVARPR